MAKIPAGAWVLVGDGEKALFLRNDGDDAFPNLKVIREAHNTNDAETSRTDFHTVEKEAFAHQMAERLYKAAHRGEYDSLVVVAPPVVLGELRKALHKEVESRLLFDLAKDYTNQPVDQIEAALAKA